MTTPQKKVRFVSDNTAKVISRKHNASVLLENTLDTHETKTKSRSFQRAQSKLSSILDRAVELTNSEELKERVAAASHRLGHEKLNILVVGEFSRGKSTFINALIGLAVLPSKVNPTTATINLITHGEESEMKVRYRSGEVEIVDLPATSVNRFLDAYVTTTNEKSQAIETIVISVPGKMSYLNCVLVDTPGVNDLDDMREEITYSFLSRADACIVLLDGQQPLSESERRFLRDRVLSRDISRLFFIVNRMDEIPHPGSDPIPEQSERIRNYVETRLRESLTELGAVQIYPLASKPVLRSRVKGELSAWDEVFAHMEQELYTFVDENANRNRIPDHLDRIAQILTDIHILLVKRLETIGMTSKELQEEFSELRRQHELALAGVDGVNAVVLDEKRNLVNNLQNMMDTKLAELKSNLLQEAGNAIDDSDLLLIKSTLTRGVRDLISDIEEHVHEWRRGLLSQLQRDFSSVFEPKALTRTALFKTDDDFVLVDGLELDRFSVKEVRDKTLKENLLAFGAGGGLGLIGVTLLGPVGIAVAMIGGGLVDHRIEKQHNKKEMERIRAETQENISRQLKLLLDKCKERASELAEKAGEYTAREIEDLLTERRSMLEMMIRTGQETLNQKQEDAAGRQSGLQLKLQNCKALIAETTQLREEML